MTNRHTVGILALGLLAVVGCPPPPSPPPPPPVPEGTSCGALVVACYDEFAHDAANLACFLPTTRWNRTELRWKLADPLPNILQTEQLDAAERAFATWSAASTLSFVRVEASASADIVISFVEGEHDDSFPFDGAGHVLGHAYFPGSPIPGAIHIDAAGVLATNPAEGEFALYTVLLHEIGHALGLEHDPDDDSVMAPRYHVREDTGLTTTDVDAIQRLYGSRDGLVPPSAVLLSVEDCNAPPGNLTVDNPDTDEDGIPDTIEIFVLGTDFNNVDTDGDGVSDFDEVFRDGTPPNNPISEDDPDDDDDELPLSLELFLGTKPQDSDTDDDGLLDGIEVFRLGTDPLRADTDGDDVNDMKDAAPTNVGFDDEVGTSPDCNENQISDLIEIANGTSPDCNRNNTPDECDVEEGGASPDCNGNDVPDECDIMTGDSCDANTNDRPDDCEAGNLCVDGDLCTTDRVENCVCVHLPRDCDDGLFCNGAETCNAGDCVGSTSPCAANETCDEEMNACIPITGGGGGGGGGSGGCQDDTGCPTATPFCLSGSCVQCKAPTDCDDNDICTTDTCINNVCANTAVDCNDGLFCNGLETCDPASGCVAGQDPCGDQNCNEGTDECADCLKDSDCDDGLFCNGVEGCDGICFPGQSPCSANENCDESIDTCVPRCTTNADCNDGVFCNGVESCNVASGVCVPGSNPCAPGQPCTEAPGQCVSSLQFTPGLDNLFGTTAGDAFTAPLQFNASTGTVAPTLQTGDSANGLGGSDTLAAQFNLNVPTTVAPKLTSIETLNVEDLGSAPTTLQGSGFTGLTTVNTVNSTNANALTVNNLANVVAAGMTNTSSGLNLSFITSATIGTKDTIDLSLSNVSGGTFQFTTGATNGIENLNVSSTGPVPNTLASIVQITGTSLGLLTVAGESGLTISNPLPLSVITVNAGTSTGAVNVDVSGSTGNLVISGGFGNDTFNMGANYTTADLVNGGAGTDTLGLTSAAAGVPAPQANVLNMETVAITDALANNVTASRFGSITTINLRQGFGAAATLTVVSAASINLGTANLSTDSTANGTVNIPGSGTSDSVTMTLNDHDSNSAFLFTGAETLNLMSIPRGDGIGADGGANVIGGALTLTPTIGAGIVNLTGSANLVITGPVTAGTFNAASFTGNLSMSPGGATAGITITGGSGNDTLTGSAASDVISGGAGNDTIQGQGGNDVLTGGSGLDTFTMSFADRPDTITDFEAPFDDFQWTTLLRSIDGTVTSPNFQSGSPGVPIGPNRTIYELVDPAVASQTAANVVQALGNTVGTTNTDANVLFVIYTTGGGAGIWNWRNVDPNVDADELTLVANLPSVAQGTLAAANFP